MDGDRASPKSTQGCNNWGTGYEMFLEAHTCAWRLLPTTPHPGVNCHEPGLRLAIDLMVHDEAE